jgi:glycosyltransferase involved in cell wall biosynthesis
VKIEIVHTDLNPCGGAEQVAISTMEALSLLGEEFEITTSRSISFPRLEKAFGVQRIGRILPHISRINITNLPRLNPEKDSTPRFTINTHGDVLPFYELSFSPHTALTYCHFPIILQMTDDYGISYLKYLCKYGVLSESTVETPSACESALKQIREQYRLMLDNTLVITNSEFSRRKIRDSVAIDPTVLLPPVNVEEFHTVAFSRMREDYILVISRINRSKRIENAILLAKILKASNIGKGMVIVGNLSEDDRDYYTEIFKMIKENDLADYVSISTSVEITGLKKIMQKSCVYFHPLPDEPFGISIAEAMSAGLIPIVPSTGGFTEFVPEKYRYRDLVQAATLVSKALLASEDERIAVSDLVKHLSIANYIHGFQQLFENGVYSSPLLLNANSKRNLQMSESVGH